LIYVNPKSSEEKIYNLSEDKNETLIKIANSVASRYLPAPRLKRLAEIKTNGVHLSPALSGDWKK
jgi:hypothetical protein